MERKGIITMKGNPMTLVGPELNVGDKAPDFTVLDNALQPVNLAKSAGKIRLISVVPSLDTPVCDAQTRRFNEEMAKLPANVAVITVSMDLPFAQKRFCGTAGLNIPCVSDFNEGSFGRAYGVLIKELRLLARAIFVVGPDDRIKYMEIVPEVTAHPNYDAALKAAQG